MTATGSPPAAETSLARDILHAARYYLGGRRALVASAVIAVAAGLAFNWSWLVAAGIAPVLVAVLPCIAMCALGLCMSRMTGSSCPTDAVSQKSIENDQMNHMAGNHDKAAQVLAQDAIEGGAGQPRGAVRPASHGRKNMVRS